MSLITRRGDNNDVWCHGRENGYDDDDEDEDEDYATHATDDDGDVGCQGREKLNMELGKPSREKSAVFFNIVQKAFDPPPLLFGHHVVNFF